MGIVSHTSQGTTSQRSFTILIILIDLSTTGVRYLVQKLQYGQNEDLTSRFWDLIAVVSFSPLEVHILNKNDLVTLTLVLKMMHNIF